MRKIRDQKGQTAVEYILLLVVVVSIVTSLFVLIKNKYLGNAEQCDRPQNKELILCKINNFLTPSGGNKPFQYFPFKK